MLLDIKKIYDRKLAASNGEIGHVRDVYFDDKTWAVRYLVVETGNWLTGRSVLLAPHSLGRFDQDEKILPVNLTRQQIENSPSIDAHRPVSRQYEENYYRYYGWPTYWEGGEIWGMSGYPVVTKSTASEVWRNYDYSRWDDIHLRSAKAVTGYALEAIDGTIGTVSSYMMDDKSWTIRDLVVETGHWYSGKEVLIAPSKIKRISYPESKVFVTLTKEDIKQTLENNVVLAGTGIH